MACSVVSCRLVRTTYKPLPAWLAKRKRGRQALLTVLQRDAHEEVCPKRDEQLLELQASAGSLALQSIPSKAALSAILTNVPLTQNVHTALLAWSKQGF